MCAHVQEYIVGVVKCVFTCVPPLKEWVSGGGLGGWGGVSSWVNPVPVGRGGISWLVLIPITSQREKANKEAQHLLLYSLYRYHCRERITSSKHQNFTGFSEVWQLLRTVT